MRAMILAAGRGKRMGKLTQNTPKPLQIIGNTTLIQRNIDILFAAGVEKIIINTHYLGEQIISHLQSYKNLIFIQEKMLLNSGGGVINALPYLSEEFIVLNADVVCDIDLTTLSIAKNKLATLVLVDNPEHNPCGDFDFQKQRLTFSGIGMYHKKLFTGYNGAIGLATIVREHLLDIDFIHHQGLWIDVGTPERLALANTLLK